MLGLMALLHRQYPPLVWYLRMPPRCTFLVAPAPTPVAGKFDQWRRCCRHSRQKHSRQSLIPSLIMGPKVAHVAGLKGQFIG